MFNKGHLYPVKEEVKKFTKEIPLKEYPRPNLVRNSYLCLNGTWDFYLGKAETAPGTYTSKILVPFAVESPLSGIEKLVEPDEIMWYSREVKIPPEMNDKNLILHFDGVDQECEIFINDELKATHVGGYTPFQLELGKISSSFKLTLKVIDRTDLSYHTRGKQRLDPQNSCFYSSSSGIYKPVWLEGVEEEFIKNVFFYPSYDKRSVEVLVEANSTKDITLEIENQKTLVKSGVKTEIKLLAFHPWSIEDPFLYQVKITLGKDEVSSYFGVRKISRGDYQGKEAFYLNDKPLIINGLLDQGYFFLGNLTPRSYQDYENDIKKAKDLGFNCLRKHVKIECPMFYYLADKLGMLLIQDFPNGGRPYRFFNAVAPRLFPFMDEKYLKANKLGRKEEASQQEFEKESEEYLVLLNNYPSIIIYTIFNEGWGEFAPEQNYNRLKKKESYRLFDTASGWYDTPFSDIYSVHSYDTAGKLRLDHLAKRPYLLSEIGGIGYKEKDHFYFGFLYGHHVAFKKENLNKKYEKLYRREIIPLLKKGLLQGTIYTQLTDCEREGNGILTFDRVLKIDEELIKSINKEILEIQLSRNN
ncbi:MAG: glycoside hydrolase family 2 [Bacilli bacterium]|nr:glycoside hydrolase family 2 [Bacilli bacterium]